MSAFASPRFLSRVMFADAASCAAIGALQLLFADALARSTGLSPALLLATGGFMVVYAVAAAWIGSRPQPPRRLIGLIAAGNLGWAAGCVALLATASGAITTVGFAWVLAQAAAVTVLAELQITGLRRAPVPRRGAWAG